MQAVPGAVDLAFTHLALVGSALTLGFWLPTIARRG